MISNFHQQFFGDSLRRGPSPAQASFAKLLEHLSQDDVELEEITRIVTSDPALALTIIRLSNTAYYGHSSASSSIQEAIARLGSIEILKLVTLVSASETLHRQYHAYEMDTIEMRNMALVAALTMEMLADMVDVERHIAYSVGLLHGIGKIYIDNYLTVTCDGEIFAPRMNYFALSDWERMKVGLNHADVAAILMHKWEFPEKLYQPIQFQFSPLGAGEHIKCAGLLRISLAIAAEIVMPKENEGSLDRVPHEIWKKLGIKKEDLTEYMPDIREEHSRVLQMLSLIG